MCESVQSLVVFDRLLIHFISTVRVRLLIFSSSISLIRLHHAIFIAHFHFYSFCEQK